MGIGGRYLKFADRSLRLRRLAGGRGSGRPLCRGPFRFLRTLDFIEVFLFVFDESLVLLFTVKSLAYRESSVT